MSVKIIAAVKRPANLSFDYLKDWWLNEHAPEVHSWPGVLAYHVNLATEEDGPFDGVTEIWFDSKESLDRTADIPACQATRRAGLALAPDTTSFLAAEQVIVSDEAQAVASEGLNRFKLMEVWKWSKGLTHRQAETEWLNEHSRRIAKCQGVQSYHLNLSETSNERIDGLAEAWFGSRVEAEHAFAVAEATWAPPMGAKRLAFLAEEHIIIPAGPGGLQPS